MSKYLKHLLTAFLVVCMAVCLGISATACTDKPTGDGGDTDGDKDTFPSSVSITVVLDNGTPVENVEVQLCALKDADNLGLCLMYVKTNAQGVATISIDEANGKNYEIHLKKETIPEGYNYVNAEGTPYANLNVAEGKVGKGMQIDVTKTTPVTITLQLGVEKTIPVGESYVFTAPADGYYLFTCDAPSSGWSLNDEVQDGDSKTIKLDKGATATVAISPDSTQYETDENGQTKVIDSFTLKVEKGTAPAVGSKDNPLALTVGTAAQFSVNLELIEDKLNSDPSTGECPTYLKWGVDGYYATFTTDKAGSYKFIFTYGEDDELDIEANAGASYAAFTGEYGSTDDGGYVVYNEFNADTTYLVKITTFTEDFKDLVNEGTASLNYSVKVEYVDGSEPSEDAYTLTLVLGENTYTIDEDFEWGPTYTCTFVGEANTAYTVTINSDNTLNSTPGATLDLTADENGVITFTAGAGFDDTQVIINISLATSD